MDKKRVLMLCPTFFGYQKVIAEGLRAQGYEVDLYDERPGNSFVVKTLLRYRLPLHRAVVRRYYDRIMAENRDRDYDYVFVIKCESIDHEQIEKMRALYPRAKFILYLWDSLRNTPGGLEKMADYDRVLTFDPADAEKYRLPLRPLFCMNGIPEREEPVEFQYDIAFVGTAHSIRPRVVKQVEAFCREKGYRMFYYFYSPHPLVYLYFKLTNPDYRYITKKDVHFESLSSREVREIYRRSRCILDVEHVRQSGLTPRPVDMLGVRRKLITTNERVKQFDFYLPENYLIIDRDHPVIDEAFLKSPYREVDPAITRRYTLDAFLREIFEEGTFERRLF